MRANSVQLARFFVVTLLVSVMAALLLAALPNFEPEVRATDQRILLFWMLYTAPICIAQVTVFLVVRWLARK
jgi:hypothetical protein